ncbi:MAG: type I restriction endonuclease subunit R [Planctomycetaceae bacterium]|nr:type I restriction endonuclease subunit R [Planctomycetaceae bacterium]
MNSLPSTLETLISQIPALQLLINMGWEYLTPDEALAARGGKNSSVFLDRILEEQLRALNEINFRGHTQAFSEGNISTAIRRLRDERFDGLIRTNEKLYDRLTLGTTLPQTIAGDTKSFPLNYIDWREWSRNLFHVTAEFSVARTSSQETRRPDIVLFVNGIPFAVIENKSPNAKVEGGGSPLDQAISQMIRNQGIHEIPRLFGYVQVVLALAVGDAKYATVGTKAKYWAVWKEPQSDEKALKELVSRALSDDDLNKLFSGEFAPARSYFEQLATQRGREITEQDRLLYSLCRPERLMEMAERYVLFDGGDKKIARYQQYFCVKRILERIQHREVDGSRRGGVVWHTQGSGKSLTMVMLAKALALELPREGADEFKVVLVTDRVDLDDQIYGTFRNCGTSPVQATTGRHLAKLLADHQSRILTTVIDKFETALQVIKPIDNANIFALVDESHRGQFGETHTRMRRVLRNGCFIGFTGTPIAKGQKTTIKKFGGMIHAYTIKEAVDDKAVLRLLYEGREVPQSVDAAQIDRWFEEWTDNLTKKQKADLKKKFASAVELNKTEQRIMAIAWDISKHFSQTWKGSPFKGQLVAPDKATALLYKKYLDEFGMVSSEVLISGPDEREGHEEVDKPEELSDDDKAKVIAFWNQMMAKHGGPSEYQRNLINAFTHSDEPEIIIVVHKLLTGFDAPRNTVLYLCRTLKDHTLLQAIARVNRLYEGKEFGYVIDYVGVLQNLDKALDLYGKLADFDSADLVGTVISVSEEIDLLPQRHSDVRELFNSLPNTQDQEAYERLLADDALRERFYQRLSVFSRTLGLALSTISFFEKTPASKVNRYKEDLKFFQMLRRSVQRRYQEVVSYDEYEPRIKKLLNQHLKTSEVELLVQPLNLFDSEEREAELKRLGSDAARADAIASQTKKVISQKMNEDPAFYKKFSRMLQEAIDDWRARRISDAEYLGKSREISDKVINRRDDELPSKLQHYDDAKAYYGEVREVLEKYHVDGFQPVDQAAEAALKIDQIVEERRCVDWVQNEDVQNRMKTDIEDYLFELQESKHVPLSLEDIDQILDGCIRIARERRPQ